MFSKQIFSRLALLTVAMCAVLTAGAINAYGQNSNFTYQGRLTDSGTAASGFYDFEFRLFDANGVQIGPVVSREDVQVFKGVFTTTLDFGAQAFDGTDRSLEIAVRSGASTDAFTTLAPRQAVTSTPYSLRTLSAAKADAADNATMTTDSQKLGGIAAGQYVRTDDPRLVGGGPPAPGSPNYIQNGTTPQTANFSVSGDGTAGGTLSGKIVSAGQQFNIGGNAVLRATSHLTSVGIGSGVTPSGVLSNSFFGVNAGQKTTGPANSFFGASAGKANTTGRSNSFFGSGAGAANLDGQNNSFFGISAGVVNVSGENNSFFGGFAGGRNISSGNSFFGYRAGATSRSGEGNSFFGLSAGSKVTTGAENTFIGSGTGNAITTEGGNTFIGVLADGASGVHGSTAIGANATVTASNSVILGAAGVNVGIGTTAPKFRLQVDGGSIAITTGGKGLILKSPNGQICRAIVLSDQGAIVTASLACP